MTARPVVIPMEIESTFNEEQKEYLAGFMLAAARRGDTFFAGHTAGGLITADPASGAANLAAPAEETYFGTPLDDLCKEERIKYEENPLDIWEKLLAHARDERFPEGGDVFRFKFHGLFYVAPAQDSFMLRLRTPGSILTARQLRGLAEMAEEWGGGEAHITTRSNLQIRELQPKNIVRVLMKLQELGMTSRGSGADNIRNITATPTSGLDLQEILDVAPLAQALNFYILNSRDLFGLPRNSTLPSIVAALSAWWPIPMTSPSSRRAYRRAAPCRPAPTFARSSAALRGIASSPAIAASSSRGSRRSLWLQR